MIYITAVHLEGGTGHQHIAEVQWTNRVSGESSQATREAMVRFIDEGNRVWVTDAAGHDVPVGVVNANPPYIRSFADGDWNNNLLNLPKY